MCLEKMVKQEFVERILVETIDKYYQGEYRFEEVARDIDGYVVENVYGSTVVESNTSKVIRLNFYPLNIIKQLQGHRTYNKMLIEEIAKLFIEFIVLHELKHVYQFNKELTYKEYKRQSYENNAYERDANNFALKELSNRDRYTKWVLDLVPWERQFKNYINPDNREEIEQEFEKIKAMLKFDVEI